MTTPTNWPNPERPGYPLLPDQTGYHWVKGKEDGKVCKVFWNGHSYGPDRRAFAAFFIAERYDYVGAFLSPEKVNQLLAAERGRCAQEAIHIGESWDGNELSPTNTARHIAHAIRNLGAVA